MNSRPVGRAGRISASSTAQGRAAMAKRREPSSSGPKAVSPARIAGKAEAQAMTATQSNFRGKGTVSEPKDMQISLYPPGNMQRSELLDNRQDEWRAVT